ncbi:MULTISPECIES: amidohydrolase [Paenarthrobacter]|uniref:Amidohydrolase n=1 Tax=Paenarthrobacter ureafaciens TaxID=37931 RepID=A0AAX3EJX6_PAEUR|nr:MULTISPECIES: amidohydrolase [Paenarthrobacter]NKR12376.1 amidohydrolase [Arthrobacter sp. M5]NKR14207.1 amidohydrolase [Arthrobacter sp. M6]OEH61346.1 amidohydrolase [Arthrobacter sp. D2]OEH64224.1 amidohydrolase [Arthrobacter sp. D4]MDO5863307.1 amidohydrolase [Paenarthrobacter sp. SD-2]
MKLDLLLQNADIVTMDPDRPTAESMGIWQGRIVGFDGDLAGLEATQVLDLGGTTITPGFIDAHCHTTWFGLGLAELDVSGARALAELYDLLRGAVSGGVEAGREQWLFATGFNQAHLDGAFPDIDELDRITGNRPFFMRHTSGHMAVVNTAALRLAGAESPSFPDPDGGEIVRDAAGRPTGVVQETAQELIQQLILPYSLEDIEAALERATKYYASEGITSFTEAGVGGGWIGHSPAELAAYQRAASNGRLHARAQVMPVLDILHGLNGHAADSPAAAPIGLDLGIATGFGGDFLSLGPAKVFMDGSLLGETAAVSHEFCSHGHKDNTGNKGYFQADPDQLRERIEAAYAAGWSIAAHAIGDRAIDLALDIITDCQATYGPRRIPNRIEHASMTRPGQLPRLAGAGIAVTPQSSFFRDLGDAMTESLGPERLDWAYRASSFLEAGVALAGSSDRPVADGNVLRGMQAFVDRMTESGVVFGNPAERLTPRQAVAAYTSGAAAATGALADKGTLTPGKLADFTVLSGSPLQAPDISELRVLATAVGGRFTYQSTDFQTGPSTESLVAARISASHSS